MSVQSEQCFFTKCMDIFCLRNSINAFYAMLSSNLKYISSSNFKYITVKKSYYEQKRRIIWICVATWRKHDLQENWIRYLTQSWMTQCIVWLYERRKSTFFIFLLDDNLLIITKYTVLNLTINILLKVNIT